MDILGTNDAYFQILLCNSIAAMEFGVESSRDFHA